MSCTRYGCDKMVGVLHANIAIGLWRPDTALVLRGALKNIGF